MRNKATMTGLLCAGIVVLFGADSCDDNSPPAVESDSSQSYSEGSTVPTDNNVYTLTGQVVAEVNSVTHQTEAAHGDLFGYNGYASGSYFGPVESGKGFVRVMVRDMTPSTDLATPGEVVILKVTDTKATALVTGDVITFKCRRQYEAVAAVLDNQTFNADEVGTWELDYCRMASPEVQVKDQ